ncbi:MAG: ferredoxin, partial [Gammaproteobacteria bacterium]|nr:ferredoxin [Gammaproteobacteria bacterium]
YTICPDSAIPGLVNSISEIFETTVLRIEKQGQPTRHLRRALRGVEKKLRTALNGHDDHAPIAMLLPEAINETLAESELEEHDRNLLASEFDLFEGAMEGFQFASTKPFFLNREKKSSGSGGLFSITVNPYTCKGCMECVDVCEDDALRPQPQTTASVERLRRDWAYWLDLPTTAPDYIRIDDLDEKIGALETLLLSKENYGSMVCGDGACIGCGEKSIVHIFTGTVTALMQPRVKQHLAHIDHLIQSLERHIRSRLVDSMDLGSADTIHAIIEQHQEIDLTLSRLTAGLDGHQHATPIDSEWLQRVTLLLEKLRHLKWQYTSATTQNGRANMGMVNATDCTSVWGSSFPFAPYPFPWSSNLFQDSPSMAMGLFEGHMTKMAEGFKAIRQAELEILGNYQPEVHDPIFTHFNWEQFSEEEFRLCPPVVSVGGDGAMYDIGFQNLSRMMMSGMPIKVLILDTQVYSNTGGQACTSSYIGQVADMTPFGKTSAGKKEIRKEMSIIAMAHRTSYVLQGAISNLTHLIEGYVDGLNSRRPAIFNIYAVCQPEHGVGDDASHRQSKMAVESRAYPLFSYNPDLGTTFADCCTLHGNPALEADWPSYHLPYIDEKGKEQSMKLPFTFADFALTEGRFRKQFRKAPPETWNDEMVPVADFIEMDEAQREGQLPYVWGVDSKNRLTRVVVSRELILSTLERRDFWRQLKSLVGVEQALNANRIIEQTRVEMAQNLSRSLLQLAGGGSAASLAALSPAEGSGKTATESNSAASGDYEPVWVETPECTACDECVEINPAIFAYNSDKKAVIVDPRGGPFVDIVKAAEKCTAVVIHPGTPVNPNEANLDKLIQRAAKYQ